MTRHSHINPIIYEALDILAQKEAIIFRIAVDNSPVDLIALHPDRITLICVVRSRAPVTSAKTAIARCRAHIHALQAIGNPALYEKEIWIFSRPDGWRFYRVFPGGLWVVNHGAAKAEAQEIETLVTETNSPAAKPTAYNARSQGAQFPEPGYTSRTRSASR